MDVEDVVVRVQGSSCGETLALPRLGDCADGFKRRERRLVLDVIEVEDPPARAEVRPGRDSVAGDQEPAFGPPEGQMARRVAGRMHDLQWPERIAFVEQLVDGIRDVPRPIEPEPELERKQLERLMRDDRDRLCAALAGDDVGLPAVGVYSRSTGAFESSEHAEMRAMSMGDRDPLEVGRRTSQA